VNRTMIQSIDCSFIARADVPEGGQKTILNPKKPAAFHRNPKGVFQEPCFFSSLPMETGCQRAKTGSRIFVIIFIA
jgi:hypothetical protein